ncbi:hypothetical protein [Galactobacter caseinivorans]|uniref:hypothetical protein n=1 Tax=Galactobacter caseinivorans TaxID=2676123 RepID=UPI0013143025|nr:hypothetical protein [Galactobacter caseinivorans]
MNQHQIRIAWPLFALVIVVGLTNIATGAKLYPGFWIAWAVVVGVGIATAIAVRKAGRA